MEIPLLSDLVAPLLDRRGVVPIYRQLYVAIRHAIMEGRLAAGQKLPSSRELAAHLKVSRTTVVGAYAQLQEDGCVTGDTGSGTYVTDIRSRFVKAPNPAAQPEPILSRRGAALMRTPAGIPELEGAFVPGVPDIRHFPSRLWQRLQNRYLVATERSLMGYANLGGYLPLRRALAHYVGASRSVRCTPDQVIITMGTNQSLDLCSRLLCDEGDAVYVENPCHWGARAVLNAAGLRVVPVPVDEEGMQVPQQVPEPAPRMLYVTPAHQFPMGAILSSDRRRQLLSLAGEAGAWILEDDYDSEFRYDGAPMPSLQSQDAQQRVIYLGTFSKVMYSGMRLSYLIVPEHLVEVFAGASLRLYRPGHLPLQAAVADFILEGHFSAHIRHMRAIYADRQAELRSQIKQHFGSEVVLSGGQAGLHLTARFPAGTPLAALQRAALDKAIVLRRLNVFDCDAGGERDGFLLGYGAIEQQLVGPAVRSLAQLYEAGRSTHSSPSGSVKNFACGA